jgi:CHAD domain-containing protein
MTAHALRPGEGVGEALRAIAIQTLTSGEEVIADPARESPVAVHDIRRIMKRWRAFLRLLEPFLGEASLKLRREARDLSRALAVARDAQSALDALNSAVEGEEGHASLSPRSLATIRSRLEGLRASGEDVSWTPERREQMSDYLARAQAEIAQWPLDHLSFRDIAARLEQTYRRARNAVPQDWRSAHAEDLHELRRRVIEHRYQMELVEPVWPRLGRIWVDEAQRLRTRLGAYQDLAVLAHMTGPHQPLARWRSRLAPLIEEQQAAQVRAAARIAARLFAESPKAFRRRLEALWEAQGGD